MQARLVEGNSPGIQRFGRQAAKAPAISDGAFAMNERLKLVYAGVPYEDRVGALFRGEAQPDGVTLECLPFHDVADLFRRMSVFSEFPVAEMSIASTARMVGQGDSAFVALPIFLSRAFRHSQIYVRRDAEIDHPADLAGKRIGVIEYEMTAAVWIRGILSDDHHVNPSSIHWYTGGWEQPSTKHRSDHTYPGVELTRVRDRSLIDLLMVGELDGVIGPKAPTAFSTTSNVISRLFADYRTVETDYFRRTGIYPMMHHVVIRREIYEENRWLALSLLDAFSRAKAAGLARLGDYDKPAVMHPWIIDDLRRLKDQLGVQDFFPYGIPANVGAIDTLLRYCAEQDITPGQLSIRDLYAEEIIDWAERS